MSDEVKKTKNLRIQFPRAHFSVVWTVPFCSAFICFQENKLFYFSNSRIKTHLCSQSGVLASLAFEDLCVSFHGDYWHTAMGKPVKCLTDVREESRSEVFSQKLWTLSSHFGFDRPI